MLLAKSTPAPNELPDLPPDSWCERSEIGVHHWIVARVLPTPTQAAGWLHQCTLCDEQHEQATEKLAYAAWSDCCEIHGTPRLRGNRCDYCV